MKIFLAIFLCAATAFAGDMAALKTQSRSLSASGMVLLPDQVAWMNGNASRAITGTTVTTNIVTRDDLTVKLEGVLRSIAPTYGITLTDTLASARAKFVAVYSTNTGNTAASILARDQVLDDKATFQTAYAVLKSLDVTASAATTNVVSTPILGPSWAEANGFTKGITEDQIREALRQ